MLVLLERLEKGMYRSWVDLITTNKKLLKRAGDIYVLICLAYHYSVLRV